MSDELLYKKSLPRLRMVQKISHYFKRIIKDLFFHSHHTVEQPRVRLAYCKQREAVNSHMWMTGGLKCRTGLKVSSLRADEGVCENSCKENNILLRVFNWSKLMVHEDLCISH